jgi:hypothetical protein
MIGKIYKYAYHNKLDLILHKWTGFTLKIELPSALS